MTTATKTRPDRHAAAAARRAEMDALAAQLPALADALAEDPESELARKFEHFAQRYSERNAMLILAQDENAVEVNGYQQWIALGRKVRHGETSRIRVLAPAGERNADVAEVQPGHGTAKRERKFFRYAAVFDLSQTQTLAEWDAEKALRDAGQE